MGSTSAQTLKDNSKLFDAPNGSQVGAAQIAGTALKLLNRNGFWVHVEVNGKTGWLKASAVTFASGTSGATAVDTARMSKGNIVATSAARGLSAKDLISGTPKPEEVLKMATSAPDSSSVHSFTVKGGIRFVEQKVTLNVVEMKSKPAAKGPNVSSPGGARSAPSTTSHGKKDGDDW